MPIPDEPAAPRSADPEVALLEERLGCPLPDAALARAALTHKSYVNEHRGEALIDNERLEFLGDAVIDLAVSHRLMERFPEAREGDLSKIRASLVDEAALARLARTLGLGPLLRLGRGEELTGGREKASLLADAFEAVVAVIYTSSGIDPVLRLLDRFLGEAFEQAAAGTLDRDFKTQLQELAQNRARATPRYRVVGERGPDHEKTFEVELEVRGEPLGRGTGRSKKDAEQAAARAGLEVLLARAPAEGSPPPPPEPEPVPGAVAPAPAPPSALEAKPAQARPPPLPEVLAAAEAASGGIPRMKPPAARPARRPAARKARPPARKKAPARPASKAKAKARAKAARAKKPRRTR